MKPIAMEAVVLVEGRDESEVEVWEFLVELAAEELHQPNGLGALAVLAGEGQQDVFDAPVEDAEQRGVVGQEGGVADASEALVFAEVALGRIGQVDGYFGVDAGGDGVGVEEVIEASVLELVDLLDVVMSFDLVFLRHLGLNGVSYCVKKKGI